MGEVKYVNWLSSGDGWLSVVTQTSGINGFSVAAGLQVVVTARKADRTHFVFKEGSNPKDGVFVGRRANVITRDPRTNELTLVDNPRDMRSEEALIFIDLYRSKAIFDRYPMLEGELWMGARSGTKARGPIAVRMKTQGVPEEMIAKDDRDTQAKIGWSALGLPDFPHKLADGYEAKFKRVWFPIYPRSKIMHLDNEERYFHCGKYSDNCLAVDPTRWDSVYEYLIQRRKGTTCVGAMHIQYKD